jgi:hypothetical protein
LEHTFSFRLTLQNKTKNDDEALLEERRTENEIVDEEVQNTAKRLT